METSDPPLSIRKLLIRQAVIVSVVVLVIGVILTAVSVGWNDATRQLGWALVFSVGVGAFTLWQSASKARKGFIDATNPQFALVPVRREEWPGIDWKGIDDYASRFEALGFRRLGEFTPNKPSVGVRGVALMLSDPDDTRIVEVQHFERLAPTPLMGDEHFDVKIAIGSIAGYATDAAYLKSLPARDWREVDATAIDATATTAAAPEATAEDLALRHRMESGASWFYWIAALSLVNAVSAAMGSSWGFVIGLGITQLLSALAQAGEVAEDASVVVIGIVWILTFAVIAGFALLGWLARRPSVAAFAIGIAVFALDTLVFLIAGDWIGLGFHALALFFLWNGMAAARRIKRQAALAGVATAAAGG